MRWSVKVKRSSSRSGWVQRETAHCLFAAGAAGAKQWAYKEKCVSHRMHVPPVRLDGTVLDGTRPREDGTSATQLLHACNYHTRDHLLSPVKFADAACHERESLWRS